MSILKNNIKTNINENGKSEVRKLGLKEFILKHLDLKKSTSPTVEKQKPPEPSENVDSKPSISCLSITQTIEVVQSDKKKIKLDEFIQMKRKSLGDLSKINLNSEKLRECCTSSSSEEEKAKSNESSPNLKEKTLAIPRPYDSFLPDQETLNYFKAKSEEWKGYSKNLVDTHCHFDMLFPKKSKIEDYFKDFECFYLDNFEACINVICDPYKYSNRSRLNWYLNSYKHSKIYLTIGCHPHFSESWNDKTESLIYSFLKNPRVVAIGECGLDMSKKNCVSLKIQKEVFEIQLEIARETKKPLVIHCRDQEETVYEIMCQKLETNHRIHLHCFTGTWSMAKKYLDSFPNLCIGITPLITFNSNYSLRELVMNIPLDRLLVETDAPYFVPKLENFPSNIEYSHPGFVFATVECMAKHRNVSINTLLDITRKNVKKVYSF